ncbi:acetyl/propionyl/methylcrotonyl-CoA carboxylase subunit alpha [Enterovirga sp.]|uniref:acetyl/propionyl/methylcrotonyl-CoA carboxylase subunit alpha n=1 Tax=Enterovirga sp. TaxID=2026350 RepID=UPI002C14843E|nr:acetyl/propionyl/methylcrotonyl-CoA carboxylase subunit alpha [Enterovirga sp.]HMO28433.1 acetyl/propionyl/methylcrotonyl-CoA carboxylase subunit alpha [Enterovirga sp.]
MKTLTSVLVANRGEIACRVFRTARRLGLRTVAVYSDADRDAMHVAEADEAHRIGPAPAAESYLRIEAIVEAARKARADCIHPGYGFLSERAEFAEACEAAGIVFVGPPASAIRAMGLKDAAKALAEKAGVPIVPGYHGERQEPDFLRRKAYEIGYPVLIKAVAGGGGKGMRRVDKQMEFEAALESAQREAASAFGDPRVLVEKYVLSPRHVEIQVFADGHGNAVSLFERDCSLQRRHQKVIEEAPAPGMPEEMRAIMGRAATEAAKAVGYRGAGTVEFIADGREGLRPDRFYFMEMNTRLQVEHPVTEAITGLDLVELQFHVAAGHPLPFSQDDLVIRGHAVEARLYAEDPASGFLPSTGRLWALGLPGGEGVRVDTGVREGDAVTPFYDPMIAKVIARGETRDEALDRLSTALGRTVVAGPKTNVAFLRTLCDAPGFRSGTFDTGFIDRNLGALVAPGDRRAAVAAAAVKLLELHDRALNPPALKVAGQGHVTWGRDPWRRRDAFQFSGPRRSPVLLSVEGEKVAVDLAWDEQERVRVAIPSSGYDACPELGWSDATHRDTFDKGRGELVVAGDAVLAVHEGRQTRVAFFDPFDVDLEHLDEGGTVKAPMHGKVVAVFVAPGERVTRGHRLAVLEAMKMEHALLAPSDGEVAEVLAEAGQQVAEGARLIVLRAEEG